MLELPVTARQVQVEECAINYLVWNEDETTLPPLVLLHGRMSHAFCWAPVVPLLNRHPCVAIDFSGMGDSGWREAYSYQDRMSEVCAVVEECGFEKPILVSHSFGAVIACRLVEQDALRWAGLVACDPSIEHPDLWPQQVPRAEPVALERPHKIRQGPRELVDRFRFAPPQVSCEPAIEEYIAWQGVRQVEGGFSWKFDPRVYSQYEEGHDDWWVGHSQMFCNLWSPKVLIYGGVSEFLNRETVKGIESQAIHLLKSIEIPHAAHHIMADQPVALAVAIGQAVELICEASTLED